MHWAWPVTPITWFFWLFSIFKRECFPRRLTPCWLGYRSPCEATGAGAPWSQLCLQALTAPGTWLSPKQPDATHPLLLSVSTGKTASGSHRNLEMQKCPQNPAPSDLPGPQITASRHLHGLKVLCCAAVAGECCTKGWIPHTQPISPLPLWQKHNLRKQRQPLACNLHSLLF